MEFLNNKIFRYAFLLIILVELISLLGYYYPLINQLAFFAIVLIALIASLNKLEYGLYLLLAELFIGSFGYLLYFEHGATKISLRIALWLIVMSVWAAKTLIDWIGTKKLKINFLASAYFSYFLILFIFIAWGFINGLLNKNLPGNLFKDFERWLFFATILPLDAVIINKKNIDAILQVFSAATVWLSLKTILFLYVFSHHFNSLSLDLYRWTSDARIGEITKMPAGFYRIFIQSHIFVLIGFFMILIFNFKLSPNQQAKNKISIASRFSLLASYIAAILISFSRSYWFGLLAGLIFLFILYFIKEKINLKIFFTRAGYMLSVAAASVILITVVVKFPFPKTTGEFNPATIIEDRAGQLSDEAAASSRWSLLPKLWSKIQLAPIQGEGFGATVTYKASDPRVLAQNPSGEYTTYAFEWGWLDVWLKLGLPGFLAYLVLIGKIIYDVIKLNLPDDKDKLLAHGLASGLIAVAAVSVFSPYTNHPLGIGYLILAVAMLEGIKKAQRQGSGI